MEKAERIRVPAPGKGHLGLRGGGGVPPAGVRPPPRGTGRERPRPAPPSPEPVESLEGWPQPDGGTQT